MAMQKDYSSYSDQELESIANGNIPENHEDYSDEELMKIAGEKPEKKQGFIDSLIDEEKRNFINIGAGLSEGLRGLGNLPHMLHLPYAPHFEKTDFAKLYGKTDASTLSDKLVQGFAQFIPSLFLPGANIGKAGQLLEKIPKVGKFAKGAIEQAIPQAAYGATQNEEKPLLGAAEGAAGSVAGSGIGHALESVINRLRPSNMLRGNLSPEELAHNLEVAKGTETGLGNVIESPTLKRTQENVLPQVIASGASKTMGRVGEQLKGKTEDVLGKLNKDESTTNYGEKILKGLQESAEEVRKIKNEKFRKVNELAEKNKVGTNRSNLRITSKELLKEIKSDPDLAKFTNKEDINLIKDLAPTVKRFQVAKETKIPKDAVGRPLKVREKVGRENKEKVYSLESTDILRGKIGEKLQEAFEKGEHPKQKLYSKLKNALEKDVKQGIEESGNPELKQAHKEAMQYYKYDYAPYKQKDIAKFLREGGDPDTILSHFLKGGQNDRSVHLSKLQDKLPEDSKTLLASAYFSKAMNKKNKVDPLKFRTLYDNLGENQKNVLLGKGQLRKEIHNLSDLAGKNTEAFNLMFNPSTGQRGLDYAKMAQLITAISGGVPGIALAGGLSGAARGANKLLTSEKYREKLVKSMIENKRTKLPKKGISKLGSMAAQLQDKEHNPMELELVKKR